MRVMIRNRILPNLSVEAPAMPLRMVLLTRLPQSSRSHSLTLFAILNIVLVSWTNSLLGIKVDLVYGQGLALVRFTRMSTAEYARILLLMP